MEIQQSADSTREEQETTTCSLDIKKFKDKSREELERIANSVPSPNDYTPQEVAYAIRVTSGSHFGTLQRQRGYRVPVCKLGNLSYKLDGLDSSLD